MKIAVIGATGTIGSKIAAELEKRGLSALSMQTPLCVWLNNLPADTAGTWDLRHAQDVVHIAPINFGTNRRRD